jgi:hypothetical protein
VTTLRVPSDSVAKFDFGIFPNKDNFTEGP